MALKKVILIWRWGINILWTSPFALHHLSARFRHWLDQLDEAHSHRCLPGSRRQRASRSAWARVSLRYRQGYFMPANLNRTQVRALGGPVPRYNVIMTLPVGGWRACEVKWFIVQCSSLAALTVPSTLYRRQTPLASTQHPRPISLGSGTWILPQERTT